MSTEAQNPPERPRLGGIEALRGLAASAVVLYHAARHVDKAYGAPGLAHAFLPGHAGVDLFFVLSGFIILHVHARDIGVPARLPHYANRRFSRVMPLYWVALCVTILAGSLGGHGWPAPWRVAVSASLLPAHLEPLLGVAWTLQYEIVFYAAFALLVLDPKIGAALLAAWLACVLAVAAAPGLAPACLPASLTGAYNLEFFLGMAAAFLVRLPALPNPVWLIAAGGTLLVVGGAAEWAGVLNGYTPPARWAYGIPAALLILGLAVREQRGSLAIPAILSELGAASYAIYLFHFLFIGAAWQCAVRAGLAPHLPRGVCFALLAGAGLGGGWAAHCLVEKPLLRVVRRRAH